MARLKTHKGSKRGLGDHSLLGTCLRSVVVAGMVGTSACAGGSSDLEDNVAEQRHAVIQSQRISLTLPSSVDFRSVAAASGSAFLVGDRAQLLNPSGGFAPSSHAGPSVATYGYDTRVGSITSIGPVKLLDRASVSGSVTTGQQVTYGHNPGSVVVSGPITTNAPLTPPSLIQWNVPFNVVTNNVTVTQGTNSLAPGSYGSVTLQSGGLTLRAGTYYIDRLTLEPNTTFTINSSAGPVFLYVRSSLIFRANMVGAPDKLLLGYLGTQLANLERTFSGTIVAPNARVRLAVGNTPHTGAVLAKEVELDPGVKLTFRPFADWNQVQLNVVPRFECVETVATGSRSAVFGFTNPNTNAVSLPIGTQNTFVPAPANRGQPTSFASGTFSNSFSFGLTDSALRWSLNGIDAVVDIAKACPASLGVPALIDATVKSTSPLANFGGESSLRVTPGEFSLVSFDRAALVAARGAGRLVRGAKLEVSLISGSAEIDASPMRRVWTEAGATWSCAEDTNVSPTLESCQEPQRWIMAKKPGSWDNPYDADVAIPGVQASGKVVFDVTDDVQALLSGGQHAPVSWILQARAAGASVLGSREGGKPARLVLDTVAVSDLDLAGAPPFSVAVDPTLATTDSLPPFADGGARPLAVLQTSDGDILRYVQNELLVLTDDAAELAAIKTRWGATEVAAPAVTMPGLPKARVLRIDAARANPATLVANLRKLIDRPDGLQKVSSDAALRLLAAAADEKLRGTIVDVNWLAPGANVTLAGFRDRQLLDGTPIDQPDWNDGPAPTSANAYDWTNFGPATHQVVEAWELMFFAKKLRPVVDVAIIDAGFSNEHQDQENFTQFVCPSGACKNPFPCGNGNPCPWHGVHVAGAGFGMPNNQRGGAGPGAEVSDLSLVWGFGDMGTLLISIPALVIGGEDIINLSNAIPVPDWLSWSTSLAEATLWQARRLGVLIFAASGNEKTDVDKKRCYNVILGEVCPWEEKVWFPCESAGVNCIGATRYRDKARASYSNYGGAVRYYATGTALTGADPDHEMGDQYAGHTGTSYSSPFMAGTAALTWAASSNPSAGEVERCLSSARTSGAGNRVVNVLRAVQCALGQSAQNLPPMVEITSPVSEFPSYGAVTPLTLIADAYDRESGADLRIVWTSSVEGPIGSSAPGAPLVYFPSGPGLRTITAGAIDPLNSSLRGEDTASIAMSPAPPNVQILYPLAGSDVFSGLPTELIAHVTNLSGIFAVQPCGTSVWTGSVGGLDAFGNLVGCSAFGTFPAAGAGSTTVSMTVDGLTGTATRAFNVVSDGQLHAVITNPVRDATLFARIINNQPVMLTAASNVTSPVSATYTWMIRRVNHNNVAEFPGTILTGQTASFTPVYAITPDCDEPVALIVLSVVDSLGRATEASVAVKVNGVAHCDPP
jgi:serine protease